MSECGKNTRNFCFTHVLNCTVIDNDNFMTVIMNCEKDEAIIAFWFFFFATCFGTVVLIGRELLQIIFTGKYYLRLWDNMIELLILISTVSFLALSLFYVTIARHFAAWSIFFGWLELTLFIGRIPNIGIYIYMAFRVIKIILLFILVFFPVLAAFTFAFYIIHPHATVFDNPLTAFLKGSQKFCSKNVF